MSHSTHYRSFQRISANLQSPANLLTGAKHPKLEIITTKTDNSKMFIGSIINDMLCSYHSTATAVTSDRPKPTRSQAVARVADCIDSQQTI